MTETPTRWTDRHPNRLAGFLVPLLLLAGTGIAQQPRPVPPLSLETLASVRYKPAAFRGKIVVLCWNGLGCPMSKVYLPRLQSLARHFADEPVQFFLVNSNVQDDVTALRRLARDVDLDFPVVRDGGGVLAKRYGVTRTTEVLVLVDGRRLAYRGAVDDQYGYRRNRSADDRGAGTWRKAQPERHYLRDAVAAVLQQKPVVLPRTDPLGCALGLAATEAATSTDLTFHGDIQPLLQRHCQRCHRDGGSAPFALESYGQARGWGEMIQEVTSERRMPPWNADPKVGRFQNDPSLTDEQIKKIRDWVQGGMPKGDPDRAPKPRTWPRGWQIGEPDVVYKSGKVEVPAEGRLPYRYVRVRTDFAEDRWVQAAQVRSTNPEVVHHVLVLLQEGAASRRRKDRPYRPPFHWTDLFRDVPARERMRHIRRNQKYLPDLLRAGGGIQGYFLAELPGAPPIVFPDDQARFLPAGATLIFQIHHTPNGRPTTSETELALRFRKTPPKHARSVHAMASVTFEIPPGAADHPVETTFRFPRGATLLSLLPHMHLRGRSVRYTLIRPDGRREVLLHVPRYDFDWQQEYVLEQPLRVPRGSRLLAEATYDNSRKNPQNPDPSRWVRFGLQSEEEMMIPYFEVIWDR